MRWSSRVSLLLCLLSLSTPLLAQETRSLCPAGQAHRAYLAGTLALSHQDAQGAVTHFAQAVQCAPTNPVYAKMLAMAQRRHREPRPLSQGGR